jgi:hypothetical protein
MNSVLYSYEFRIHMSFNYLYLYESSVSNTHYSETFSDAHFQLRLYMLGCGVVVVQSNQYLDIAKPVTNKYEE